MMMSVGGDVGAAGGETGVTSGFCVGADCGLSEKVGRIGGGWILSLSHTTRRNSGVEARDGTH